MNRSGGHRHQRHRANCAYDSIAGKSDSHRCPKVDTAFERKRSAMQFRKMLGKR